MTQAKKRVIAVSGCKGGVGKTVVAINLALAMSKLGQRVVLMDGNLSVPGVEFALGINQYEENDPLSSDLLYSSFTKNELSDEVGPSFHQRAILEGPSGVKILTPSAQRGWKERIEIIRAVELVQSMDDLISDLDTLIVDTAPGLAPDNMVLMQAATEVIVVITQEYDSVINAARQIRILYECFNVYQFYVVVNLVTSRRSGAKQFERLQQLLMDDKQIILICLGAIPNDKVVGEATSSQAAVLTSNKDCRSARAFHRIGYQISQLPVPEPKGRIEFFLSGRIKERV